MIVAFAVLGNPLLFYNPWVLRRTSYGEGIRRQEIPRPRPSVSQRHLGFGGIIFGWWRYSYIPNHKENNLLLQKMFVIPSIKYSALYATSTYWNYPPRRLQLLHNFCFASICLILYFSFVYTEILFERVEFVCLSMWFIAISYWMMEKENIWGWIKNLKFITVIHFN
jgi:hypothetical protein